MITNGWCYLFILFGSIFDIQWMWAVGTGYAAILYLPFTAEKIVTIPLAIWFQTLFFKNDLKLKKQLDDMKFDLWCIIHKRKITKAKLCIIGFNITEYYKKRGF